MSKKLLSTTEGKRPLGRPRHRWEDNVTLDFIPIRRWDVGWIHMVLDVDQLYAVMYKVKSVWVPSPMRNLLNVD